MNGRVPDIAPGDHSLLDAANGMLYRRVNDGAWSLVYVSRGCRKLLGYSPGEMTAPETRDYCRYLHPSSIEPFLEEAERAEKEKRPFVLAYVTSHKDGRDPWVLDMGHGTYDENGRLLYVDGFVADYKDRERIDEFINLSNREIQKYSDSFRFGNMVGRSEAMQVLFGTILKVGGSEENVLLIGESGTGKELAAREIHKTSNRADKPFVPVNCGAIPENLMESELFGYRKGAFSGADRDKKGLLEAAHGGTLFLDEIGETPMSMQVKLLRAIEGDGFTPMGGCEVVRPDLRIVAATNRDLEAMVDSGLIRSDFYYRINVIPIHLPPLRERPEDVPILFGYFLGDFGNVPFVPGRSLKALVDYDWPGNVRELKNQARHYATLGSLDIPGLKNEPKSRIRQGETLKAHLARCEAEAIAKTLAEHQWNRTQAARALGMDRRTLFTKIRRYGLNLRDGEGMG